MKKIKVSGEQMARMVLACLGLCEIVDIDINGKETVKVVCKVKREELLELQNIDPLDNCPNFTDWRVDRASSWKLDRASRREQDSASRFKNPQKNFNLSILQFKFRMCSTLPIVGADPCVRPMSERHISTGLASVVRLSALGRHMGLPLQATV